MNVLVLNGSPKGKNSVTLQTALYLEKLYPSHQFKTLDVGRMIKKIESDFTESRELLEWSEIIVFVYPVYTLIVPYQLNRFIELMKEHDVHITGKYAAQISTSKHFYDVTAHKFIEENCYDFGLRYLGGLSADMEDLLEEDGREDARNFFAKILFDIDNEIYSDIESKRYSKKKEIHQVTLENLNKSNAKDVVVITNASQEDENLKNMIADFKNICAYEVREINIRDYPFKGGCLGCFQCSVSEKCIYPDGFDEYLRNEIQTADAFIYAFTIENHYTHSSFKCFDDRQFCNGHRTVSAGKATGYIISGNYQNERNLQMIVEARSDIAGMYPCGVATDEGDTTKEIKNLGKSLNYALENGLRMPQTFYGVGGTKIFRDLVYQMQGFMEADHKFYKKHGIYDFPQNNRKKILQMKILGGVMKIPSVQKKMKGQLNQYIIQPYNKIIEEAKPI